MVRVPIEGITVGVLMVVGKPVVGITEAVIVELPVVGGAVVGVTEGVTVEVPVVGGLVVGVCIERVTVEVPVATLRESQR